MLHRDFLLATGPVALERLHLRREGSRQLVERALRRCPAAVGSRRGREAPCGMHGCHMNGGHLGRKHRLELIFGLMSLITESMNLVRAPRQYF